MRGLWMLSSILLAGSPAAKAPGPIDVAWCPVEIVTRQDAVQVPSGWEARDGGAKHPWRNVAVLEGDPSHRASLVPDNDEAVEHGRAYTVVWTFQPGTEYWLQCEYDATSVVLVKRVPAGSTACEVAFARNDWPVGLTCR